MNEELANKIARLKTEAFEDLSHVSDAGALEACRLKYLGKKGALTSVLKTLGGLDPSERPEVGRQVNILKTELEGRLKSLFENIGGVTRKDTSSGTYFDVTLSGRGVRAGREHPLRKVAGEIVDTFTGMGFSVYEGPEIETDYYNFEALGVAKDHPARDMQDTFYVEGGRLLRTHTSPVQIHVMENDRPPIYAVFPGAVYRRDNDVTHSPMFHQVEGLVVDENITMGDLKGVLSEFCRNIFGGKLAVRFRPSYFPFTEPSAELDISCVLCGQKGCRVCKGSGWLEIMGCGMVDPTVFGFVKIDPKKFSGFAFGMGVERIAMLKYAIDDIRLFYENDMRFLEQF